MSIQERDRAVEILACLVRHLEGLKASVKDAIELFRVVRVEEDYVKK